MIVILRPDATEEQIKHLVDKAQKLGLKAHISRGVERTIIGFIGPEDVLQVTPLVVFPGVERVMRVLAPFRLVSREFKKEDTELTVNLELEKIEIKGNSVNLQEGQNLDLGGIVK